MKLGKKTAKHHSTIGTEVVNLSKPLTLIEKIKLFKMYLKNQEGGVIIDCPFCHSTEIHFTSQGEGIENDRVVYKSLYLCSKCLSICDNRQEWVKH